MIYFSLCFKVLLCSKGSWLPVFVAESPASAGGICAGAFVENTAAWDRRGSHMCGRALCVCLCAGWCVVVVEDAGEAGVEDLEK